MRLILLILLFSPITLIAQQKHAKPYEQINANIKQSKEYYATIDSLQKEIISLKQKYENESSLTEKSFNSISTQISAASYNLTVFGILFAIAAIILGIYVTYVEKKIIRIREDNKQLLSESEKIKDEVFATNELIQKDINGLFLKIKREETINILNRLSKVPRDISNVIHDLVSRELEREDYEILKKAYLKLKENPSISQGLMRVNCEDNYKLLFFQHFLDISIKDNTIGPDLVSFYPEGIICAFENDILKSSKDFIKAIVDLGYNTRVDEISSFFKGISRSSHADLKQVYLIIQKTLNERDDKFKFFNLIPDTKDCLIGKKNYGEILIEEYNDKNPTASENIAFKRTHEIANELEAEEKKES